MSKCGICGRERPLETCVVVELTPEERAYLRSTGVDPAREYIYCKGCWSTLGDQSAGPQFGKGLIQQHLQGMGFANAEQVASRFHARLVDLVNKKKQTS